MVKLGVLLIGVAIIAPVVWSDEKPTLAQAGIAGLPRASVDYHRDVRPVLNRRCVVCHGCYDAPCQLKLQDPAGLQRGGSKTPVYDGTRLTAAQPTRLHRDAHDEAEWRALGFHDVLEAGAGQADRRAGLMARFLELRREWPLPDQDVFPASFDFSRDRAPQCPSIDEFDAFADEHPLWSMPFGLPDLADTEYDILQRWLAAGAPAAPARRLPDAIAESVAAWEAFFNGDSAKQQLVARYLYEHLFLAHLYVDDAGQETLFFKLVRSRTPPGSPIDIIATRRPFEDPGVERVYYRLSRDPETIVDKTHMPYALNPERRTRWQRWFLDLPYEVKTLPGYELKTAANPFVAFEAIPSASRHRFLLDEAQFTIMNFIKGPVCRGSVALNVIQDHFWVFFTQPGFLDSSEYDRFLAREEKHLRLPADAGSGPWSLTNWLAYARAQQKYVSAKLEFIRSQRTTFARGKTDVIWDGDGNNSNAALTVFRHHDSATVVRGLVGDLPKTAWVIDYPVLERIHYLLVAGFDVFGSASHQAMTRLYMDFLRMESEMNFLAFLPPATRQHEVAYWYRDAVASVRDYLDVYFTHDVIDPLYEYQTDEPKQELFALLRGRVDAALGPNPYAVESLSLSPEAHDALIRIGRAPAVAASIIPENAFISVRGYGVVTLLANRAYTNISSMFQEADRRVPAEDTLTLANGFIGAYPNVFFEVEPADLPGFASALTAIESGSDYARFVDRFGVRRTSKRFWSLSDELLDASRRMQPLAAGLFDYNRLDNR
jgi:hypothetical protein